MAYNLKAVKAKVKKALPDAEFYQDEDGELVKRGDQHLYIYRPGAPPWRAGHIELEAADVVAYFKRMEGQSRE